MSFLANETRSSAIADGPRDATCQSNSCQLLRNSVGTTCTTNREQIEVMELEGYSQPTYNKLMHSATTRSTVVGVIHKLTVDEFADCTNTPTTCCGEIFYVHNVEIAHVTLTTPTQGSVSQHKANTSHDQPAFEVSSLICSEILHGS